MKNKRKIRISVIIIAVLLVVCFDTCKKDNDNNGSPSNETGKCLITKFEYVSDPSDILKYEFTYGDNSVLIRQDLWEEEDHLHRLFEYNENGQLMKIDEYENSDFFAYETFEYNQSGHVIRINQFDNTGDEGYLLFGYDDNFRLTTVTIYLNSSLNQKSTIVDNVSLFSSLRDKFSRNEKLKSILIQNGTREIMSVISLNWDDNGNIVSETWHSGEDLIENHSYTFDDKKNPASEFNMPYPLWNVSLGRFISQHNVVKYTYFSDYFNPETEVYEYSYIYNTYDYPTTMYDNWLDDGDGPDEYALEYICIGEPNPEYKPTVTTGNVTNISESAAHCGGDVTNQGSSPVTSRGVCWSVNHNPTLSDPHTVDGNGIGVFTSQMEGLLSDTSYYVRAYAINNAGTAYGNEVGFETLFDDALPTVETEDITNVTINSATGGGNVISEGGRAVTARGVCWSENENPTLMDFHSFDGNGIGDFISQITALNPNTKYYVRAYATNYTGTAYGNQVAFTTSTIVINCPESIEYSGQAYQTVQIGYQCWMAENLNIGTLIQGENVMQDNGAIEKYCYDDNPVNCDNYGGLYQMDEMMQYTTQEGTQGICPNGWHIPTDEEWKILEGLVDSQYPVGDPEWDSIDCRGFDTGKNLKSTSGWNNNGNGSDLNGFMALPGGLRKTDGLLINLGYIGAWWSSSAYSDTDNWGYVMRYDNDGSCRNNYNKAYGFSVRCLMDY